MIIIFCFFSFLFVYFCYFSYFTLFLQFFYMSFSLLYSLGGVGIFLHLQHTSFIDQWIYYQFITKQVLVYTSYIFQFPCKYVNIFFEKKGYVFLSFTILVCPNGRHLFFCFFDLEILTTPSWCQPKCLCSFPNIFFVIQLGWHYLGLSFDSGLIIHFLGLMFGFLSQQLFVTFTGFFLISML